MTTNEMRKRVFEVGNRLSADLPRTAAFEEAWELVKAQSVTVSVRGVTFGSRQAALRRLANYPASAVRAFLLPEPENTHDPNAIAVMVGVNGGRGYYKLGYVPADTARTVNALGRCRDCYGRKCTDEKCPLFGLAQRKGKLPDGKKAIRTHCVWCMNGNPIMLCSCRACKIREYRSENHCNIHIDFSPMP